MRSEIDPRRSIIPLAYAQSVQKPTIWYPLPIFSPWSVWDPGTGTGGWSFPAYTIDQFGWCKFRGLVGQNSGGASTNPTQIGGAVPTPATEQSTSVPYSPVPGTGSTGKDHMFNAFSSAGTGIQLQIFWNGSYWDLRVAASIPNGNWVSLETVQYQT